ncbi:tripartite tricarboxylate transporter permease [Chelativorans sp. YIM 93263]|uniref:tripartite tricarboxylate transporter permease n=1 Tax=Chelativorans sp. YIM 93263 TaxID=2906648 RepID=UPI002379AD8A|nr:tripartite tricarboxylate transporter permease [Chelativorans sp. YIM 93263]
MDLFANLSLGFSVALSPANLLYCLVGVTVGTLIGVLPGIGPMATIAILLPVTFGLDPVAALIMLAGIYYGSMYGSAITSILLNTPGHAASAVVCLDGYPLARNGQGGLALVISALSSFVGGSLAIILVMTFAPMVAEFGLRFSSPEYFSMLILGLTAAAGLSQGSFIKGIAMVLLGLGIGTVGTDLTSGVQRFTFDNWNLADGINFVILAMGFFAVTEIVFNLEQKGRSTLVHTRFAMADLTAAVRSFARMWGAVLRGFGIGFTFGALPGSGPTIATFVAYSAEKSVARDSSRFGKGALEGVAGPESANNSASIAGLIPTLTLGVPGDAIMAMMLGALLIFGITPGPGVIVDEPELFWGLVASLWIGNVLLLALNIPLIGVWARVLTIPYKLLYPSILLFICIGVFSINNRTFDIGLLALFSVVGYVLAKLDFPAAPVLLGLILGPMIEDHLRRALLMGRGDFSMFFTRPISAILLLATLGIVIYVIVSTIQQARQARARDETEVRQ